MSIEGQGKYAGFATPEGTRRYEARALQSSGGIAADHFREAPGGLRLSSLGMGTYLGDVDPQTDAQVRDAVVASVASGAVNVLDTAINYRNQRAERTVAQGLRLLFQQGVQRDEVFISSKNGYLAPDADATEDFRTAFIRELLEPGLIDAQDIVGGQHCMHPGYLNHQLNRSLDNLGLETLDLMYLHNAAEAQLPVVGRYVFMERLRHAFAFYESARAEGRIRAYGLATWNCFREALNDAPEYLALEAVVELARAVGGEDHGFRFVQLPFNLAFTEAATLENQPLPGPHGGELHDFLTVAEHYGVGVFTSVPLLQGQLLGGGRLPRYPGLETPAQVCLQFVRNQEQILAPLVGQKHPAHVGDNLRVSAVSPKCPSAV